MPPPTASYTLGDPVPLRWDHGPVSFGLMLGAQVVSWSAPGARDLLISRCWQGLFLYPSRGLTDEELSLSPRCLFPGTLGDASACVVDWNGDGVDEVIAVSRQAFLCGLERRGAFPELSLHLAGPLREADSGLCFNIPFENPHHPVLDDLGGYFDRAFLNPCRVVAYPVEGCGAASLVIGDWGGNLWWLPDLSRGRGPAAYRGVPYEKRDEDLPTPVGQELVRQHGRAFAKPEHKLCDEGGQPLLLGTGTDTGGLRYPGGAARPTLYRNEHTGAADLLVLAGMAGSTLLYMQRAGDGPGGAPAFRDLGPVTLEGVERLGRTINDFHAAAAVYPLDGWNELLLTVHGRLAVFRNLRRDEEKPAFALERVVSAKDALAGCDYIQEILADGRGRRCTVESWGNTLETRRIHGRGAALRLSPAATSIADQHGVFRVEGETDPQGGADWGWHRVGRWDFDESGRQHLVVGTDRGLLYLLIDDPAWRGDNGFRFRSVGPLCDTEGHVIKVHNRAMAAGIDLDGDGREDLLVGGCSYQCGIALDPTPGGRLYALVHAGLDADGLPRLEPLRPVEIEGYPVDRAHTNRHVFLQAVDIDGDGVREVLISIQWQDPGRLLICRPTGEPARLCYTGVDVPQPRAIEEWVLDLDGDGELESVFSGSEDGVGHLRRVVRAGGGGGR
ncbi:MAG: hypothetical protein AB1505_33700 [Candidatus Latescibacterota bacterium]